MDTFAVKSSNLGSPGVLAHLGIWKQKLLDFKLFTFDIYFIFWEIKETKAMHFYFFLACG